MSVPMRSISVCPPYRRGLDGIWPGIPLTKYRKVCLQGAMNRFGKIHSLTTCPLDPAQYFLLDERRSNENSDSGHDVVCGCRRRLAHERVGSACPETCGKELQLEVG